MILDDAERFYKRMGCSHFHMSREFPEQYEKYKKLNLSIQIEEEWRQNVISEYFSKLLCEESEQIWSIHSSLIDLLANSKTKLSINAEKLMNLMLTLKSSSKKSSILILENMVGRTTSYKDGGIYFIVANGVDIVKIYKTCLELVDFRCDDIDNDKNPFSGWNDMRSRKEMALLNLEKAKLKFENI